VGSIIDITKEKNAVQTKARWKHKLKVWWNRYGIGYSFLAPYLILFALFYIIPVIVVIGISLTNYNIIQNPKWLGIANYRLLFTDDDVFLISLRNTAVFSLISGPFGYIMSFMAAWVINQLKFRKGFALAFYAPSITSSIAMSVVWMWFFASDRYGMINNILINFGIIHEPVLWNLNPNTILPVVIFISIWMSMGTGFLVFLAGFQNISKELYEAAAIDGIKSKFQELWLITMPLMKPQLLLGAINSIVNSLSVFDVAKTVGGMPSPNYAAHTIVAHLYDYAFIRFQMGYASAVAVVLFLITFILGRICMKVFSSKDIY